MTAVLSDGGASDQSVDQAKPGSWYGHGHRKGLDRMTSAIPTP